jgi:glycosyltransferase involved in cell wall biosynthesis
MCDISVVLNAHREGLLAVPSLRSVSAGVSDATESGLKVEVLIVLDRADRLTIEVAEKWAQRIPEAKILAVDNGDLGISRNDGVKHARGKWVSFLDADDMWCVDWLSRAHTFGSASTRDVVLHPEVNVYFGTRSHVYRHVDMESPNFDLSALALTNCWTALCFTRRSVLVETPYRSTRLSEQIGYEDWAWNLETISKGLVHKIVPSTGHAIRNKEVSLLRQTTSQACLPYSSPVFKAMIARRAAERQDCEAHR